MQLLTEPDSTGTSRQRVTATQVAKHIRMRSGTSIGDHERLANVFTPTERHALWFAHREHFQRPTQELFDIVLADCHRRIARAVNAGMLSLWPREGGAA
jgi:hypothetical protein